jgi:hypothetical protein
MEKSTMSDSSMAGVKASDMTMPGVKMMNLSPPDIGELAAVFKKARGDGDANMMRVAEMAVMRLAAGEAASVEGAVLSHFALRGQ